MKKIFKIRSGSRKRGGVLVEFLLSTIFWVPLLLGTAGIGINITRAISVAQICRDAGHMFAYGVDFSQAGNQAILVRLASGFNLSAAGNGVVIFSTIMVVADTDCLADGKAANSAECPNFNRAVLTRRLVIGNSSVRSSSFGTPPKGLLDSAGNISPDAFLVNSSLRVDAFTAILPILPGQTASIAETCFLSPDLNWGGFSSSGGNYARAIF